MDPKCKAGQTKSSGCENTIIFCLLNRHLILLFKNQTYPLFSRFKKFEIVKPFLDYTHQLQCNHTSLHKHKNGLIMT